MLVQENLKIDASHIVNKKKREIFSLKFSQTFSLATWVDRVDNYVLYRTLLLQ